jgi:hypothetical protein
MDKQLQKWITIQRFCYKRKMLSKGRILKLELIPDWQWEFDIDAKWLVIANTLKEYCKTNKLPTRSNKQFGHWVSKQRAKKKHKELSQTRIDFLNTIRGWLWEAIDHDKVWNYNVKLVIDYMNKHKKMPNRESGMYNWVYKQKKKFKHKQIKKWRFDILDSQEFWFWNNEDKWECIAKKLKIHCMNNPIPPKSCEIFGEWIGRQRYVYANKTISKKRMMFLVSIKGWGWVLNSNGEVVNG